MLNLRKVAITGGLSSGKTSVCRYFKELGAHVVSADEIVHQLLSPNTSLGRQVVDLLGERVLKEEKIDRNAMAEIVFKDPAKLQSLEKLIHPAVQNEIEKQYQHANKQGNVPLFIAEIPLLFEGNRPHGFYKTIAVWADPNACKQRFMAATGYGGEEYDRRMANQLTPEEKAKRADYIIDNTGDLKHTYEQVKDLFIKLTS